MSETTNPEIFKDVWETGALPKTERGIDVDYAHLAAMGSCFARNLNRWLNFRGYTDREMPWDILYNPFSIKGELERIYDPEVAASAEASVVHESTGTGEERFRDPWRTWLTSDSEHELKQMNGEFDDKIRDFLDKSNGMLITLGLTEVWSPIDDSKMVLNQVPIGGIRRDEQAWASRFASYAEVSEALDKTVEVVRSNITADGPIIFSLSPVPMKYTASNLSIREANTRSKATLAVALGELDSAAPNVEYFHSYEIVQALSEREGSRVWQVDGRHVGAHVVDLVARRFLDKHGRLGGVENEEMFWVPRVDEKGKVVGKLFTDLTEQ